MNKLLVFAWIAAIAIPSFSSFPPASFLDRVMDRLDKEGATEGLSDAEIEKVRKTIQNRLQRLNLNELAAGGASVQNGLQRLNLNESAADLAIWDDIWGGIKGAANAVAGWTEGAVKDVGNFAANLVKDPGGTIERAYTDTRDWVSKTATDTFNTIEDYAVVFGKDIIGFFVKKGPKCPN